MAEIKTPKYGKGNAGIVDLGLLVNETANNSLRAKGKWWDEKLKE